MLKGEFIVRFISILYFSRTFSRIAFSPSHVFFFSSFLCSVRIHRLILAAMSNFFASIFSAQIVDGHEFLLVDIDASVLKAIVSFAYTGQIEINAENVTQYATAAHTLEIDLLQHKCEQFFCATLSVRNCLEWFMFAVDNNSFRELRKRALRMMCLEFCNISTLRLNMITLDFEIFKEMIASDENTAPEEAIFERLVEWVKFDEPSRSKYVADLLRCIRMEHIPTKVRRIEMNFYENSRLILFFPLFFFLCSGTDEEGRCVLRKVRTH